MRAGNFADSLSQYSKHSDEGNDFDAKSKLSGKMGSNKNDKLIKTQKKLPDMSNQGKNMTFSSDTEDPNGLPLIKGSGSINLQGTEVYSGKVAGKTIKNGTFNQGKYMTNMNQSPSPSQTFFKCKE